MLKFDHKKNKATRFTVSLEGDVQKYAMSFLNIVNHCREYPEAFYKVENNSGNDVIVTCNPKRADNVRDFLENFGEVWHEETINYFVISCHYDRAGWNELFGDDCEVDFAVDID